MKTPWWFLHKTPLAFLLVPVSWIYYFFAKIVFLFRKIGVYKSRRKIICVGNILAGGVGKTPIVRAIAEFLDAPIVMRGYKKSAKTGNVGDEAAMLARAGFQVHVGDRKSNLVLLNRQQNETGPIVMDDGFQNPRIKKDISVLVFDQHLGYGNGFLLPAGPLREPWRAIRRADAVIVIRRARTRRKFKLPDGIPVFYATAKTISPYDENEKLYAFAGIGYPKKFFGALKNLVGKRAFADHYQYTDDDLNKLVNIAQRRGAKLITTEKDWMRLPPKMQNKIKYARLDITIDDNFWEWLGEKSKMSTLKKLVKITGRGIHSGLPVDMVVRPSKVFGIFFKRVDLKNSDPIMATYDNVGETKMRNTTIGCVTGAQVQTIEHLMAALFMAGIDSAVIEIDGAETPILDGSAAQFYDLFVRAGVTGVRRKIVVRRPVIARAAELRRGMNWVVRAKWWIINTLAGRKSNGYVMLEPNDAKTLDITATLIYPEKIIGNQTYSYSFDGTKKSVENFVKNIARARTFGKYSEWEYLKRRGMARGADETNVIALNNNGDDTLNKTIWPDEFVRHKIIDAIGDMYTSGGFVVGKLTSFKGSHALNNLVLKKLFSDAANYDIIESK